MSVVNAGQRAVSEEPELVQHLLVVVSELVLL